MLLLRVMWNRLVIGLVNRLLCRLFMEDCRCRVGWNWMDGWRLWLGWIMRYCLNILLISVVRLGMVMVLLLLRQFMVRVMRCVDRVVRLVRVIRCVSLNALNLILFVRMISLRRISVLSLIGYMIGLLVSLVDRVIVLIGVFIVVRNLVVTLLRYRRRLMKREGLLVR